MPVRWTGAARRFINGPGADSHPARSALISRARQVAGGIANQLALADIWYGAKRERISEDAIAVVTVIDNIPGQEPTVLIDIHVDENPLDEEDFPCLKGFVVGWPAWIEGEAFSKEPILIEPSDFVIDTSVSEVNFRTLVHGGTEDREAISAATGSYRRHHRGGLDVGLVDWQGRGKDLILTWEAAIGPHIAGLGVGPAAYRAFSDPSNNRVFFCGEPKAVLPEGWLVLGAAIETREGVDNLNIAVRVQSGGDIILAIVTRPWVGALDSPVTVLASGSLPYGTDVTQPFFFNKSGNVAVGLAQKQYIWPGIGASFAWRKPFEDKETSSAMVSLEIEMTSSGSLSITGLQRFDNYAVMPDLAAADTFLLKRHPELGNEIDFPAVAPTTTVTVAVDWKGDTITRCKVTFLEASGVTKFNWSDETGGAFPRTDTGSFSGSMVDALVEFENSELPSFHAFELLSNDGNYFVEYDSDGNIITGGSTHTSESRHRGITFIDLRFDLLGTSETHITTTLDKPTVNTVSPTRSIDVKWELKQGTAVLDTSAEPTFNQSLWRGRTIPEGSLQPADAERLPDIWSATLAFFSSNTQLFSQLLFRDSLFSQTSNGDFQYQGVMRFPSMNLSALTTYGLPFVDRETRMASYDGEILAYWHNTGQRVLSEFDQSDNLSRTTYGGQATSISGMVTPFSTVGLNTHLGVEGGLGFVYAPNIITQGSTELPVNIGLLSLL